MQQINTTVIERLSYDNPIIVLLYNKSKPEDIHAYNIVVKYFAENLNDSTIQQWRFLTCEYGSEEAKQIVSMFGLTQEQQ